MKYGLGQDVKLQQRMREKRFGEGMRREEVRKKEAALRRQRGSRTVLRWIGSLRSRTLIFNTLFLDSC